MPSLLRQVSRRSRVLTAAESSDSGFTLIEVIVAMFLFALIAMVVSSSLIVINKTTSSGIVRQTAMNLAQTQIDLARTTTKFADVDEITTPIVKTVSGRKFYLTQHVTWLGASDGDIGQCSSGSGASIGKTLKVTVTWDNMGVAKPVTLDSIISPDSRLGSQSTGAIVAAVLGADGRPMPGLTVTAVPDSSPNGATTVPGGPVTTDAGGCAFIPNVTPGNYDVSVKGPVTNGYIDNTQVYLPTKQGQTVSVSSSTTVPFQYDQVATFPITFAAQAGVTATSPLLPTGINVSLTNSYGIFLPPTTVSGLGATVKAHPYSAGYTIVAGDLGGLAGRDPATAPVTSAPKCVDVDPSQWPATADGTSAATQTSYPSAFLPVPAAPGATSPATTLTMGAINLKKSSSGTMTVTIKSTPVVEAGDPGCATGSTYAVKLTDTNLHTVYLPFGSWAVVKQSGLTASLPPGAPSLDATGTDSSGNFTVTLDPRVAVTP